MERRLALVVDARVDARVALVRQLDILGWDGLAVNSGAEALRAASQDLRIDVLITAIQLPDMDGRDLADRVCRTRPLTRVVFVGSSAMLPETAAARLVEPFAAIALRTALTTARVWRPPLTGG